MFRRLFGRGQDAPRTEEEAQQEEQKIEQATEKSRRGLFGQISQLFAADDPITDEFWDDLEALLIQGDVGVETTQYLVSRTIDRANRNGVKRIRDAKQMLRAEMVSVLQENAAPRQITAKPYVVLVTGVNGVGKTTLIAKLAHRYKTHGKSVMLAAGDTFRAAATEQLQTWGERAGVPVITRGQGADPGAVVYDAMDAALEHQIEILIIDTAGRLHAQANLMKELSKLKGIISRKLPGAPHEVLLVVDGNTGQNALAQVKAFDAALGLTGLVVTKLDGTAKGGVLAAIARWCTESGRDVPVYFIGIGEALEDLQPFDAAEFAQAMVG